MGVPGYRGTTPPKLFVSHDRKEIESLEALVGYTDPFELKDTFVSFEYDMDKTGGTVAELTLINPGADLEQKLFSWYAAIAPRSWKGEQVTTDEILEGLRKVDNFFIRWGYVSQPGQGGVPATENEEILALSHMHQFLLLDMDYKINDKADKLITLHFLNRWDISYKSGINNKNAFTESPKTFKTNLLVEETGLIKKPSRVIEELIMELMGGVESYTGLSNFSKQQRNLINVSWRKELEDTVESGDWSRHLSLEAQKGAKERWKPLQWTKEQFEEDLGTWGYAMTANPFTNPGAAENLSRSVINASVLKKFYLTFGIDSFFQLSSGADGTVTPRLPSPNQTDGRSQEGNDGNPTPEAKANASTADTLTTPEFVIGDADSAILTDDNPMIFPWTGSSLFVNPWTYKVLPRQKYPGDPFYRLLRGFNSDLNEIITSGRFYMARESETYIIAGAPASPAIPKNLYYAWPPGFVPVNDTDIPFYDLDSAPILKKSIEAYLEVAAEKKEQVNQDAPGSDGKTDEEKVVGEANEEAAANPPEAEIVDSSHYAQIVCPPHQILPTIQHLIHVLNSRYFKNIGEFIQAEKIEFANIPLVHRKKVENIVKERLPGLEIESKTWWANSGLIVLAPQSFFKKFFAWQDKIVSFSGVQSDPEDLNTISLSVGHQTRKDNIISDLRWKMDKGSMFLNIRRTPIMTRQLYSVMDRFENKSHRDEVMSTIRGVLRGNSKADEITETRAFGKITISDSVLGDSVFSKKVLEDALKVLTINDPEEDITTSEIMSREKVREDLRFILDNDFVDIFFPEIAKQDYSKVFVEYYITQDGQTFETNQAQLPLAGGKTKLLLPKTLSYPQDAKDARKITKSIAFYRYINPDPGKTLRLKLSSEFTFLDPTDDAAAALLRSKMDVLNIFQKLITNVEITTLGIPEMDIFTNEVMNRNIALWVHEQRVPGTYHWITGMYNVLGIMHRIDSSGYETKLRLIRKLPDKGESMRKHYTLFKAKGGS